MHDRIYLVKRNGLWFRPGAQGYTADIAEAGHFTEPDARKFGQADGVTIHPASELLPDLVEQRQRLKRNLNRLDATIREIC